MKTENKDQIYLFILISILIALLLYITPDSENNHNKITKIKIDSRLCQSYAKQENILIKYSSDGKHYIINNRSISESELKESCSSPNLGAVIK